MKMTLKKTAAILTALLMLVQMVPALAGTYSSGIVVGGAQGYREMLEIVASKGTYVLVGQDLELDVNEGYNPVWTSENEEIATIDENGVLSALVSGQVTITATDGAYSATTVVTVIDPEPLMAETQQHEGTATPEPEPVKEPTEEPAGEPTEEPAGEPTEEPSGELTEESGEETAEEPKEETKPAEQTSVQKQYAIIVVNGENTRYVYDGEEHTLDTFVATSNLDTFDASKIRVVGEIGVSATDCGTYEFKLEETNFAYDDPNVVASFVVNNGWMKITPAQVTVTAITAEKESGQPDPEFSAIVDGLYGEDAVEYSFERYPGEDPGEYVIDVIGEDKQGNYRVDYVPAILIIKGKPIVLIESSVPAGEPVYKGTEITLKAIAKGFGNAELSYQWQWSTDGENWMDISGATQDTYQYTVSRKNANYIYRVCVDTVN